MIAAIDIPVSWLSPVAEWFVEWLPWVAIVGAGIVLGPLFVLLGREILTDRDSGTFDRCMGFGLAVGGLAVLVVPIIGVLAILGVVNFV